MTGAKSERGSARVTEQRVYRKRVDKRIKKFERCWEGRSGVVL